MVGKNAILSLFLLGKQNFYCGSLINHNSVA